MAGRASIVMLGQHLPALARIDVVGEALGLSKSSAYRAATGWPLHGNGHAKRVIVPRLLAELQIPYSVVDEREVANA